MKINDSPNNDVRGQPLDSATIKKVVKRAIESNPKFKNFIKENHVYGRYVKNITKKILNSREPEIVLNHSICTISSNKTNCYILDTTLCWHKTDEGSAFWAEIHQKG